MKNCGESLFTSMTSTVDAGNYKFGLINYCPVKSEFLESQVNVIN